MFCESCLFHVEVYGLDSDLIGSAQVLEGLASTNRGHVLLFKNGTCSLEFNDVDDTLSFKLETSVA